MASRSFSSLPTAMGDQVVPGTFLTSGSSAYHVLSLLGKGAFGTVAKCLRVEDKKMVAIKMLKQQGPYLNLANMELAALCTLKSLDADKCNIVKWHQVFTDKGHMCLEFEHLDKSLYDFMIERACRPLLLKHIRPIIQQLAVALDSLKASGMIHADLKLENVMLVNHEQQPYRVKLIDFGHAGKATKASVGSYIQSRPYRSPEILLGLPFSEAIDMWSLGILAVALYLGTQLYPGRTEYDMVRYIVETQGQPEDHILFHGRKTKRFFQRNRNSKCPWKLKSPQEYYRETGFVPGEYRRFRLTCLNDILKVQTLYFENPVEKVAQMRDAMIFMDLLNGLLQLDASKRLTPSQVLEHRFITMHHLTSVIPFSLNIRSCFHIMDCLKKNTPDNRKDVGGAQRQWQRNSNTAVPLQCCANPLPAMSSKFRPNGLQMTEKVESRDAVRSFPHGTVPRRPWDAMCRLNLSARHPNPTSSTKRKMTNNDVNIPELKMTRSDLQASMPNTSWFSTRGMKLWVSPASTSTSSGFVTSSISSIGSETDRTQLVQRPGALGTVSSKAILKHGIS